MTSDAPFGLKQHRFLPDAEPTGGRTGELRAELASRAAVHADRIYLGTDGDTVLGRLLQALLRPGDRVAVALPTAPEHTRQTLAVGASYVDVGCDFHFVLRRDRLARVIDDGAVATVLIATPNPVTGVEGTTPDTGDAWLILDRRAELAPDMENIPSAGRRVDVFQSGAVVWAVAPTELVGRLRQLAPEPALAEETQRSAMTRGDAISAETVSWADIEQVGLVASASTQPWALVRHPGRSADDLAAACDAAHLTRSPTRGEHPTWRDAVRLMWPGKDGLARLAKALAATAVILGFIGCGDKSAKPEGERPPTKTMPAPAANRPAPVKASSSDPKQPPPGVQKDLHRTPIVGGCGELCRDARDALTGFTAALVATDRQSRLPLYLDSSQLVINGDRVGDRLAQMWLRGEVSPRLQALGAVVDTLGEAAEGADEAALLAHAEQAAFSQELPRKAVVDLALPKASWTITLGRRGLEWLVTEISDANR